MEFNSLQSLEAYLQSKINDALENEVAETVKDEIVMSVDRTVYDSYMPVVYTRRNFSNNGLGDRENMHSMSTGIGEITITNDAPFNPDGEKKDERGGEVEKGKIDTSKSLAYNIEYGWGNQETTYSKPRKFMEEAVKEMQESKSHVQALVNGLIERGINVDGKSFK